MARRRFQNGSIRLRNGSWELRWYEDMGEDRVLRSTTFATKKQYPTKRLAMRDPFVEKTLKGVNAMDYVPRRTSNFAAFADQWDRMILVNLKPSTRLAVRSQLKKHIVPFFGDMWLSDIEVLTVQQFVSSLALSPKTIRNLVMTLRMMWKAGKAWGWVSSDPFTGLVLPKRRRSAPRSFTLDEMRRIIQAAEGPEKVFFWLAAETGMRAGELCGLPRQDVNLESRYVRVRQSVWRGKDQSPKTLAAERTFSISTQLALCLGEFLAGQQKRAVDCGLLFQTRNGTPWDANLVVKRKLHPLLQSLHIERAGLHAFRHGNASLMDAYSVPMKVRQSRLGHTEAEMTMRYTHMRSEDEVSFASKLGEELTA